MSAEEMASKSDFSGNQISCLSKVDGKCQSHGSGSL